MRAPLLANKIDGDCFALVRAHQHGITIHNQDVMRERESGVILFITYYYGGGGLGGSSEIVKFLLSIRLGLGGGGGGKNGGTIVLPLLIDSAVDNLKLRIDCPPLNNE